MINNNNKSNDKINDNNNNDKCNNNHDNKMQLTEKMLEQQTKKHPVMAL